MSFFNEIKRIRKDFWIYFVFPVLVVCGIFLLRCGRGDSLPMAYIPVVEEKAKISVNIIPDEVDAAAGGDISIKIEESLGFDVKIDSILYTIVSSNDIEYPDRRGKFTTSLFLYLWNGIPSVKGNEIINGNLHSSKIYIPSVPANSKGLIIVFGTDENFFSVKDTARVIFR